MKFNVSSWIETGIRWLTAQILRFWFIPIAFFVAILVTMSVGLAAPASDDLNMILSFIADGSELVGPTGQIITEILFTEPVILAGGILSMFPSSSALSPSPTRALESALKYNEISQLAAADEPVVPAPLPINIMIGAGMDGVPSNFLSVEGVQFLMHFIDTTYANYKAECKKVRGNGRYFTAADETATFVLPTSQQKVCAVKKTIFSTTYTYTTNETSSVLSFLSLVGIYRYRPQNHLPTPLPTTTTDACTGIPEDAQLVWHNVPTTDEEILERIQNVQFGLTEPADRAAGTHPANQPFALDQYLGGLTFDEAGRVIGARSARLLVSLLAPAAHAPEGATEAEVAAVAANWKSPDMCASNSTKGNTQFIMYTSMPDLLGATVALMHDAKTLYWCALPLTVVLFFSTSDFRFQPRGTGKGAFFIRTHFIFTLLAAGVVGLGIGTGKAVLQLKGMSATPLNLIGSFIVLGAALDGIFVMNSHYKTVCTQLTIVVQRRARAIRANRASFADTLAPAAAEVYDVSARMVTASGLPANVDLSTQTEGSVSLISDGSMADGQGSTDDQNVAGTAPTNRDAAIDNSGNEEERFNKRNADLINAAALVVARPATLFVGWPAVYNVSDEREQAVRRRLTMVAAVEAFAPAATMVTIAMLTTCVSFWLLLQAPMEALRSFGFENGTAITFIWALFIMCIMPLWILDLFRMESGRWDIAPWIKATAHALTNAWNAYGEKEVASILYVYVQHTRDNNSVAAVDGMSILAGDHVVTELAQGVRVEQQLVEGEYPAVLASSSSEIEEPYETTENRSEHHHHHSLSGSIDEPADTPVTPVQPANQDEETELMVEPVSYISTRTTGARKLFVNPFRGLSLPSFKIDFMGALLGHVTAISTTWYGAVVVVLFSMLLVGFGIYAWCVTPSRTSPYLIDMNYLPGLEMEAIVTRDFSTEMNIRITYLGTRPDDLRNRILMRQHMDNIRAAYRTGELPLYNPGGNWDPERDSITCWVEHAPLVALDERLVAEGATNSVDVQRLMFMEEFAKMLCEPTDRPILAANTMYWRNYTQHMAFSATTDEDRQLALTNVDRAYSGLVRVLNGDFGGLEDIIATYNATIGGTELSEIMVSVGELIEWINANPNTSPPLSVLTPLIIAFGKLAPYLQNGFCAASSITKQLKIDAPLFTSCTVAVEWSEIDEQIHKNLRTYIPPALISNVAQIGDSEQAPLPDQLRVETSVFYSNFDLMLFLVDENLFWQVLTASITIVALSFAVSFLMLGSLRAGAVITIAIVCIQVSLLGVFRLMNYTINMLSFTAYLVSAGLSIDYCFHIAGGYLHSKYNVSRRARVCDAVASTGGAVSAGWLSSFCTMIPFAFTDLILYNQFFVSYVLILVLSYWFAFIVVPLLLWAFGPNVPPSKKKKNTNKTPVENVEA